MRPFLLIPILAGGMLLASCATMSQEACLQGDWAGVGFKDGEAGRAQSRLDDHAKACAKAGVVPDAAPYFAAGDHEWCAFCPPTGRVGGRLGTHFDEFSQFRVLLRV